MKKNLLQFICLTVVTTLCVSNVFAQAKETLINVEGWTYSGISEEYDRQSQGSVYPMTQRHDDGFIGSTWTNVDNPPFQGANMPLYGVGYAYSTDGGKTWSTQENRVAGIPLIWPSYAQWGANGEAILARSVDTYEYQGIQILNGLVLLTRPNKGQGEWMIRPIPYPAGYSPNNGNILAWARMTTSGTHHQYIHIMSPMRESDEKHLPGFYYRTQDGGTTWDFDGKLVTEMVQENWSTTVYNDGITFAVQGNTVACAFIYEGSHGYVLRSTDNGETWSCIKFFDTPIPNESAYEAYIPNQGCIALDNNGKIHIAFSSIRVVVNNNTYYNHILGLTSSFLSYWNEDMSPINGAVDFRAAVIMPKLYDEYFDLEQSDESKLYVKSTTVPKLPIIGYYTPIPYGYFTIEGIDWQWTGSSYGYAGHFSFPQMAFDANNTLHLAYLGLALSEEWGVHNGRCFRHPFYTTRTNDGEWTKTEYLVNHIDYIDREFAYLTLAGLGNNKMYLMAQVDPLTGTYWTYSGQSMPGHAPTHNRFTYFSITDIPTQSVEYYEKTPLNMSVFPNPAIGQATVKFEGKGNITITNMLGQTVYHVENIENEIQIPLNNMNTGVYFVIVRSENSMATQKLIVK